MAGLKELAESLGLSITTVSRALDGYSDVSEKTRLRVVAAANAAGYRPNAAARRLRRQRTDIVMMPLPSTDGEIATSHLTRVVASCARDLLAHRINLMIAPVPSEETELELCRNLVDGQRIDAMLLVRTRRNDPRVDFLLDRGIPFVTDGRTESARPHPWLDGDGFSAFKTATQRFIADGHLHIGMIGADESFYFAHDRAEGYRAAMRAAGRPELMVQGTLNEAGGYAAARQIMTGHVPPTAILCATDSMALGALAALHEMDSNVAIVGHDDLAMGAFSQPRLSSMRIDTEDQGARLAGLLLRTLAGEPVADLNELLPVTAVDRDSHLRRAI
ncbi:putative HTH-type transcriptional regulator [Ketogulonicigenium robustum]|uniref:Putative HTH-type transcriptional regulator n=1 Tax=Ketogulonicigenium robustum TaxID=92947 RepID=A0A1W6NZH1_9RHOB|nr:LacI family DNA-binding transcriptional regulator [Ketogulonicigenium robustum]ARO14604.1 putative HTH-type transcriptional regulator [Ketogulonicigenium robustum]